MDYDCEIEEEVIRSKKKVLSRWLPSSLRVASSSSEGEEDNSGGYEGEGESLARHGIRGCSKNAGAVGQNNWMPPDAYFDPYYEGISTQVQDMIASMVGNFDQTFKRE